MAETAVIRKDQAICPRCGDVATEVEFVMDPVTLSYAGHLAVVEGQQVVGVSLRCASCNCGWAPELVNG